MLSLKNGNIIGVYTPCELSIIPISNEFKP